MPFFRRRKRIYQPQSLRTIGVIDSILWCDFDDQHSLEATVEYDVPRDPPVTRMNPDEPPPEYDPYYHHMDDKIHALTLRRRANEAVVMRKENARYHNALIESMGKEMETLKSALSVSENVNAREFLMALTSMKYKGWNITRIASKFGITPAQLTSIWRDYHLAQAMLTITGSLPKTAARMVEDAQGGETVCPHCDGRTTVRMEIQYTDDEIIAAKNKKTQLKEYEIIICPNCKGEGTILKPGHEHSRDRILEMAGLTKKGGMNVTTVINMPQLESVIDELEKSKAVPVTYTEREP